MYARALATVANAPSMGARTLEVDGQRVTYYEFEEPMEKPLLDTREYRLLRLGNDLEALVISDPDTDKASAAMDIRVGHLCDPPDMQGMAHYCEHLLFMGTKKYPRENEYSEYLTNHSGSSNAFTSLENTNYFFDVGHAHLEGALDRFAQFFLEPLFDESCSEREIRAVDSEHKKNLQSDLWRGFQLDKGLCDASHPYAQFGTGNLATLWDEPRARGVDIRAELLKFHERYYSANMMKLVVLGRESVEQLSRWVVEKFARVPNKGVDAPVFPGSPLREAQLGTQVMYRTIKDTRLLDITFPIPEQVRLYRAKPAQLLSHFVGHEGHGSLFSCLKQRGWANVLSAGPMVHAAGFELFKINVELTPEGYAHYADVAAAVFQYLDMLRAQPMERWMFDEVQRLSDLRFAFKEKSSSPAMYSSTLAGQMQQGLPPAWLLSGPYLLREFDIKLIGETLAAMRPDNCRLMLAGREPPAGVALDATEQWYGTEYTVRPLAPVLDAPRAPIEGLTMPRQNAFVPANLDVLEKPVGSERGAAPRPELLHMSASARLWHKQDDRFFLPKANVALLLRTPLVNASPRTAVLSRLYVELVKDALNEYAYDAEVAGLLYNIDSQLDGIDIVVSGYSDKLADLLDAVLKTMTTLRVNQQRFEAIFDNVRRNYENFDLEEPYQHAVYYSTYLATERMWTQHEKLAVMHDITPADVEAFGESLRSHLHYEMLVHGNKSADAARSLLAAAEARIGAAPLPPAECVPPRSLLLAPGSRVAWVLPVANPDNLNSSLEYFLQVGDPTDVRLRATLALLAQIASEPCFDQLRTKEQLGYLVFSGVRTAIGQMGLRVIVQSERDAEYLESRIDAFFDHLLCLLEGMSVDEFERHRASLVHKKLEKVKNLAAEANRFWLSIHSGYYDFEHRERDAAMLKTLTKADVLSLMQTYIHPSSSARAKCVTYIQAQGTGATTPLSAEALAGVLDFVEARSGGESVPPEMREVLAAQLTSVEALMSFVREAAAAGELPESIVEADVHVEALRLARAFPRAVAPPPSPAPVDVLAPEVITDVAAFKARLMPSRPAQPVLPWSVYQADPRVPIQSIAYEQHTAATHAHM